LLGITLHILLFFEGFVKNENAEKLQKNRKNSFDFKGSNLKLLLPLNWLLYSYLGSKTFTVFP
jgi:hypothetical protein